MNRKNKRIVSLLIAAIMMMSLSGMALAYEDEDIVVADPVEMPALPSACGDVCEDHGHESVEFVGIQPANWPWTDCTNILGHSWGTWKYYGSTYTYTATTHTEHAAYTRPCTRTNCNMIDGEIRQLPSANHRWTPLYSGGVIVKHMCTVCGVTQ